MMSMERDLADRDEDDRTRAYLKGAVHHDLLRGQRALVEYELHNARRAHHDEAVVRLLERAQELDAQLIALSG